MIHPNFQRNLVNEDFVIAKLYLTYSNSWQLYLRVNPQHAIPTTTNTNPILNLLKHRKTSSPVPTADHIS